MPPLALTAATAATSPAFHCGKLNACPVTGTSLPIVIMLFDEPAPPPLNELSDVALVLVLQALTTSAMVEAAAKTCHAFLDLFMCVQSLAGLVLRTNR